MIEAKTNSYSSEFRKEIEALRAKLSTLNPNRLGGEVGRIAKRFGILPFLVFAALGASDEREPAKYTKILFKPFYPSFRGRRLFQGYAIIARDRFPESIPFFGIGRVPKDFFDNIQRYKTELFLGGFRLSLFCKIRLVAIVYIERSALYYRRDNRKNRRGVQYDHVL